MIFRQVDEIKAGLKTQTRRVVKHGEAITISSMFGKTTVYSGCVERPPFQHLDTQKKRVKWQVNRTYAIVPKRGARGVGYIRIVDLYDESLQDIRHEDALAEGVGSVEEYRLLWDSINKTKGTRWEDNPVVWVIKFEYVGEVKDEA